MDLKEFTERSKLPLKVLKFMVARGWIHDPLDEIDQIGLELLEKTWLSHNILRPQLASFSYKRRLKLIKTAGLKTKWERYAYSRLDNLPPKTNLKMHDLVREIELTFGFALKPSHVKQLYKVKKKVYNRRHRSKQGENKENKISHTDK